MEEAGQEMKATIILCGILGLGVAALVAEPAAMAAGLIASDQAIRTLEPAWMVLSGASLLTVASLVRRYVP
jgi:uncharacterized protein YybS (DUF2232 family)